MVCVLGVFDVLAYTDMDVAVPFTWIESDPKLIANPQMVKLHSFDTKVSKKDLTISGEKQGLIGGWINGYFFCCLLMGADTQGRHSCVLQD